MKVKESAFNSVWKDITKTLNPINARFVKIHARHVRTKLFALLVFLRRSFCMKAHVSLNVQLIPSNLPQLLSNANYVHITVKNVIRKLESAQSVNKMVKILCFLIISAMTNVPRELLKVLTKLHV